MRSTIGAIVPYKPEPVPTDLPPSAQRYLDAELNRIADVLRAMASLYVAPVTAAPASPD